MGIRTYLCAFVLFLVLTPSIAVGHQVTGKVTSSAGEPISGVIVTSGWSHAATDPSGRYILDQHALIVVFNAEGFQSEVKPVLASSSEVNAVMSPLDKPTWAVPACSSVSANGKRIGDQTRFVVPKHFKVKRIRDVDYYEDWVTFHSGGKRLFLKTMVGPLASHGWPGAWLYEKSNSFTERRWAGGGQSGLDVHGTANDGTRWRWAGPVVGEFVSYEGASEDAANFFDAIIDSMCTQPWPATPPSSK